MRTRARSPPVALSSGVCEVAPRAVPEAAGPPPGDAPAAGDVPGVPVVPEPEAATNLAAAAEAAMAAVSSDPADKGCLMFVK
ncbi:hypothetical protein ABBQ38_003672 [Trebouxia sp. C0009 RCD-2024]